MSDNVVNGPETRQPVGVTVVVLNAQGRPVAHASDFADAAPAGFDLRGAQRARAERQLPWLVANELMNPEAADALGDHGRELLLRRLQTEKGWKLYLIKHGDVRDLVS